jgi:hypothetical protein
MKAQTREFQGSDANHCNKIEAALHGERGGEVYVSTQSPATGAGTKASPLTAAHPCICRRRSTTTN